MILYKKDSKGKIRVLKIFTEGSILFQVSGLLDGKKVTHDKVCKGKNLGKSNETSPEEQAINEATNLSKKKIKSGYSKDLNCLSDVLLPMKVKIYQDQIKNVVSNPYLSPKLNGVNGEFRLQDGELILLSRGGNEYPMIDHLKQPVINYLNSINETSINVELYKHGWHLQDITAAVTKFKDGTHKFPTRQIAAHIFDIPSNKSVYEERLAILRAVEVTGLLYIIPASRDLDIETYFDECLINKYEGIIIRNPNGLYKYNTRSIDVFKYKKALDGEYLITGYELDVKGNPTLVCEVDADNFFKVRPKGTLKDRKIMLENIDKYIGAWYNIEYESLSKDGIPTKPVGIGLRDCDIHGNPLI